MNDGATSLLVASEFGHRAVVRKLLARGANVNVADINSYTPLIRASNFGHVDVVSLLLAAGANKHHVANTGATAASLAGDYDDDEPAVKAAVLALLAAAP